MYTDKNEYIAAGNEIHKYIASYKEGQYEPELQEQEKQVGYDR